MNVVSAADAHADFSKILDRAAQGKERLRITQDGQALAAVVPIEDLELLEDLEDRLDVEDARAAMEEAKTGGIVTLDEFRASLGR
jgi:prevent-host-death family protein